INDITDVASPRGATWGFNPVTLTAEIGQVNIVAIRDGILDFEDRVTEILAAHDIGSLFIRLWIGATNVTKYSEWMHIDDYFIDDTEGLTGGHGILGVSVLALIRGKLPTWSSGRTKLSYENKTLKFVWDSVVDSHVALADRYRGPGIEDATTIVTNQITDSTAKRTLDELAYLAGGVNTTSAGQVKFVDIHGEKDIVAVFPKEETFPVAVTPGFRDRIPEFFVPFNYDFGKQNFTREQRGFHADSITKMGQARIDEPEVLQDNIAKWIIGQTDKGDGTPDTPGESALATAVRKRVINTRGAGLIRLQFRSIYAYPELEVGDLVVVETTRFTAKDPQVARMLRGTLWVNGVVSLVHNPMGTEFTIWVRKYSDIFSTLTYADRDEFVTPLIKSVALNISSAGSLTATILTDKCKAVRVSVSTTSYPVLATTQGETLLPVDAGDTEGQVITGPLLSTTPGQTAYVSVLGYEYVDGSGTESRMSQALITNPQAVFTVIAQTDGWSSSQNAADPENGSVLLVDEADEAFSNLDDADGVETTYYVWFDVEALSIDPSDELFLTLYVNDGTTSTSWTQVARRSWPPGTNLSDQVMSFNATLSADFDLRAVLTYQNGSPGIFFGTITMHGEDDGSEAGVQYDNVTGTGGGETEGYTGQDSYAKGDVLYSDATNSLAKLGGNTTTAKQFMSQTGDGAASAAPAWEPLNVADITVDADWIPTDDATYDLGSAAKQWVDLHLSNDILIASGG
ncbi:hypothetical protein LCGC14_2001000, partial [marine sediment metagenome]